MRITHSLLLATLLVAVLLVSGCAQQPQTGTPEIEGPEAAGTVAPGAEDGGEEQVAEPAEQGPSPHLSKTKLAEGLSYANAKTLNVTFSPDGKWVAYNLHKSIALNGVPQKAYDYIWSDAPLVFSPDSKKLAYRVNDREEGKTVYKVVLLDLVSQESQEYTFSRVALTYGFSPDGKKFAYGMASIVPIEEYQLMINGQVVEWCNSAVFDFSQDSKSLACVKVEDGKEYAVVDGEKYDGIGYGKIEEIKFAPDGQRIAYVARDSALGGENYVVWDGQEGKEYYKIRNLVFSPDGKRIAYIAGRIVSGNKTRWFVVVDGQEGKEYVSVSNITFSPDGKRIAHTGVEKKPDGKLKQRVVLDGQEIGEYAEFGSPIAFSPDSKSLAYVRENALPDHITSWSQVIVDGRVVGEEKQEERWLQRKIYGPLSFSPDGRSISYGLYDEKTQALYWVVDAVE